MPFRLLVSTLLLLPACLDAPAEAPASPPEPQTVPAPERVQIQGVTLDARRPPPPTLLPEIAALGATHIAVIPFGFQQRTDDPQLKTNYDARWYSEGDAGIRALDQQADALGLRLILKPQIWIGSHDPEQWSSAIGFESEADWQTWEAGYRDFALHYARLAEEIDPPGS